jgi:hypothetical protein
MFTEPEPTEVARWWAEMASLEVAAPETPGGQSSTVSENPLQRNDCTTS